MIFLYNLCWVLLLPFIIILMIVRVIIGKEDILRLGERFGISSAPKSKKKTIWIHAASVGEAKIALNLSRFLNKTYPSHRILITTGTVTSAKMVRKNLSSTVIHQFIPLDNYLSVLLFYKYWKPQIAIFIESELWPNLLYIGSKNCPLLLINARMSDKSFSTWKKYNYIISPMLRKFRYILCQSNADTKKYEELGAKNALYAGNLKYSSNKLEVDQHNLKALISQVKDRIIWVAASTHPGDEEIICDTHIKLSKKYPSLLTIIAPRHVHRAAEIQNIMQDRNLSSILRSDKKPITPTISVYIADTMGELGLFFDVANASFIGGSFKNGGHNPIEPAYFNTSILFGPDMSNFAEIAKEFLDNKAALQIQDAEDLADKLSKIFSGDVAPTTENAGAIIQNHANVLSTYLDYIKQASND